MMFRELKRSAKVQLNSNLLIIVALNIFGSMCITLGSAVFVFGALVVSGPILYGNAVIYLNLTDFYTPKVEDLFCGFKKKFFESFLAIVIIQVLTFMWSLLLIVPGIIKGLEYSQTMFILADNDNMTAIEAIEASKELMKGHKSELALLYLSFFLWYLLCFFTLGIACFYVVPYVSVTMANYYKGLISGGRE